MQLIKAAYMECIFHHEYKIRNKQNTGGYNRDKYVGKHGIIIDITQVYEGSYGNLKTTVMKIESHSIVQEEYQKI